MPLPFDFSSDLILENARVLLRPLHEDDYQDLLVYALEEPSLWDYSLLPANGEKGMKTYTDAALLGREQETSYPFVVIDKNINSIAGSTRFYNINFFHKTLSVGYTWYGKAFQRTGLNRHCKLLLFSHAFEAWGMERIELRADARNQQSFTAMKALGCTHEGTLRNDSVAKGGRRDSVVLSFLKQEWEQGGKAALQAKTH